MATDPTVTIRQLSSADGPSEHRKLTTTQDLSSRQQHQATSPTTGQTRPHSSTAGRRGMQNGTDAESRSDVKPPSDGGRATAGTPGIPTELFPVSGFLRALLDQEKTLWERNEIILKSLKDGPGMDAALGLGLGLGLDTPSDGSSLSSDHPTNGRHASNAEQSKESLYFIRYGRQTDSIHNYFRKLEKRHSCLHLTARRAKHETIRHVERTPGRDHPEDTPPTATPNHRAAANGGNQVVILRDEELLVYRYALMCAQFPMLSAPSPPDGQSPTPSPPPLPSIFPTNMLQYSQTAPSGQEEVVSDHITSTDSTASWKPAHPITGVKEKERSLLSSSSTDTQFTVAGHQFSNAAPPPLAGASEPIPIKSGKTRTKSKSIKRNSSVTSDGTKASSLAKLPPGDSDEEAELVKLVSAKLLSGSETSSPGRAHPFTPMVNRDMLYSMVRRAFRQTEEQQVNFESGLKREYGRRSKGEILAKELAGQLQVLDNNAHPFYKPKLFVTRNGYDLWLQGEKERVKKLIDKFWHCSLPRPQLWRNFNPIDYHRMYAILLRKIVDCESRTDRKEPVHSGRTPSSPLSPTAHRMLTEFGLRYGVGELYRRIVYLEYLAKHFDYEIWYIKHCTEELRAIRGLLPRNRNRVTAVRPEMEVLRSTVHLLHGQTDNSLTRVDRLFHDSDPRKGVASLIELLAEVLDAQQNLFGKRIQSVEKWLKRYLKSGFVLRYERRKEIASDETIGSKTVQPFVLTPTLVNSLLLGTRDEVYDFRDKYQSVFRPYFDVVPFSKMEFYRLLCADACSLCAKKLHKEGSRKTISLEMLGLMYRLNERDIEWQSVIEPEHQLWRQHYQNLACVWLDILGQQVNKWTINAVANDQWTLLAFDASSPHSTLTSSRTTMVVNTRLSSRNTRRPHVMPGMRTSPFPSPNVTLVEGTFKPRVIGGTSGAFTPYRPRQKSLSILQSESSGAITDSVPASYSPGMDTSSSTSIAGEMPHLFTRAARSPGPMVTFAQKKKESSLLTSEHATHPQELEVSISVYSGSEEDELDTGKPLTVEKEGQEGVGITDSHSSSLYVSCTSEKDAFQPAESAGSDLPTVTEHSEPGTVDSSTERENGSTGQLVIPPHNGLGQTTPLHSASSATPRFNNLLDKCNAAESDIVRPKPRVPQGEQSITKPRTGSGSVMSAAETVSTDIFVNQSLSGAEDRCDLTSSPEVSPSPVGGYMEGPGALQSYLFPVSNSPVDLVMMLSRLASFTGELLTVLTPKIRKMTFNHNSKPLISVDDCAPEVTKAREQASERQRNAKNIKAEFLKKLNKVMVRSLKLYADNILCMDLCGWGSADAIKLLGEQEMHHLNRRKESGDIWGCRHMVEERHGLHPNGIPCSKKHNEKNARITRDMCIRINNIHVMISTFHSLEDHLYSMIRTESKQTISAFSYVSSDPMSEVPHNNTSLLLSKTNKPHPTRTRQSAGPNSQPSSVSTGLGPMEPDDRTSRHRGNASGAGGGGGGGGKKVLDDVPGLSLECLEYLKTVQKFQVKMIALRMNNFCKIALSELLSLKLHNCGIEKRLFPVVDYLERHRRALRKYIYPECFRDIMEHIWECLLQDIEDEALKLRQSKRPITDRAQLLLQALAHLIQFLYNKKDGLDIDKLNSTSEYLQGMLDIMTRSTDQLINIFNRLNNAHFTHNVLDLTQAPVAVHSHVLSLLRQQLRTIKKCFTGREFVRKVVEIGQGALAEALDSNENGNPPTILSSTGEHIEYNEEYASSMAQYLLDEGILIYVSHMRYQSDGSTILVTPDQLSDDSVNGYVTREGTDSIRPLGANSAVSFGSGTQSATSFMSSVSERTDGRQSETASRDPYQAQYGHSATPRQLHRQHSDRPTFSAAGNMYYKFAGSEDDEFAFFQSQILISSVHQSTRTNPVSPNRDPSHPSPRSQEANDDFLAARQGTLCLVYDLLSQRARKERVAKHFVNSPRVQEQRERTGNVSCDIIFKM